MPHSTAGFCRQGPQSAAGWCATPQLRLQHLYPRSCLGLPWQPARSKPQAQSWCSARTRPRPALCTSHCSEARTAAVASSEAAAARCSAARRAARSWHSATCAASSVVHCGSPGCIAKPRTPQVPWPARYRTQHKLAGALRYQAMKGQHRCARPEHNLDRKQAWPCCCRRAVPAALAVTPLCTGGLGGCQAA